MFTQANLETTIIKEKVWIFIVLLGVLVFGTLGHFGGWFGGELGRYLILQSNPMFGRWIGGKLFMYKIYTVDCLQFRM